MTHRPHFLGPMAPARSAEPPAQSPSASLLLDKQPLYIHVRKSLMQRIASGEWRAGAALPTEFELSREYGLSSGTVRKALDWMEQAGVIVPQQGRGTFVRDAVSEGHLRYERLRNADGTGLEATSAQAAVSVGDANANEIGRLGLRAGDKVRRVERLRRFGEGQVQLELCAAPSALFPLAAPHDIPLLELAQRSGVILGAGWERLSLQPAPLQVVEKLGIGADQPVLMLDRIIETTDGLPAEWRIAYCCIDSGYYEANLGSL